MSSVENVRIGNTSHVNQTTENIPTTASGQNSLVALATKGRSRNPSGAETEQYAQPEPDGDGQ